MCLLFCWLVLMVLVGLFSFFFLGGGCAYGFVGWF